VKIDTKQLWEEVKANHARLEACPGHRFEPIEWVDTGKEIPRKHRCAVCGGWADSIAVIWYERGVAHGRAAR
jgi:hypothetical protein